MVLTKKKSKFKLPEVTIQQLFTKQFHILTEWIGSYLFNFGLIA